MKLFGSLVFNPFKRIPMVL